MEEKGPGGTLWEEPTPPAPGGENDVSVDTSVWEQGM